MTFTEVYGLRQQPKYVLIELPGLYGLLHKLRNDDTLPIIDEDAFIDASLDTFYKKHGPVRRIQDTVNWLMCEGFNLHSQIPRRRLAAVEASIHGALIELENRLHYFNLYDEELLLWRYVKRWGKHDALLRRRTN